MIWIGTYGGGVDLFNGNPPNFTLVTVNPSATTNLQLNLVWSFWEDRDGSLWIGTQEGLNCWDRSRNLWKQYTTDTPGPMRLNSNRVRVVIQDRSGMLWIGTNGGGLNRFDLKRGVCTVFRHDPADPRSLSHDEIRAIFEDRFGDLWIGTHGGGLNRFDRRSQTFTVFRHKPDDPRSLGNDVVRTIVESHDDSLWIGTYGGGLNRFDRRSQMFQRVPPAAASGGLRGDDYIFAVYADRAGTIWLGTWGNGLGRLDPHSGAITYFTSDNGLPSDSIYGILEDQRNFLWLSTNNGLVRFDPRRNTCEGFSESDGLQSKEFNGGAFLKSKSGELFFGGINGFNSFYPERINRNPYAPPVVFTSLTILPSLQRIRGDMLGSQRITLKGRNTALTARFAMLSYAAPDHIRYICRIDGVNDEWIDLGNKHELTMAIPKPGHYRFRVKSANEDGVWNPGEATMSIHVLPPFWQTGWFRLLALLGLTMLSLLIIGIRHKILSLKSIAAPPDLESLCLEHGISRREQEVLHLVVQGKSNFEIETELYISIKTVKTHLYNIYQKCNVRNRLELINFLQGKRPPA